MQTPVMLVFINKKCLCFNVHSHVFKITTILTVLYSIAALHYCSVKWKTCMGSCVSHTSQGVVHVCQLRLDVKIICLQIFIALMIIYLHHHSSQQLMESTQPNHQRRSMDNAQTL